MVALMSPGVEVKVIDETFWKWDETYAAMCAEEDRLWKAEIDKILLEQFEKEEVSALVQKIVYGEEEPAEVTNWWSPAGINKGPFSFLLDEKYQHMLDQVKETEEVTYIPVPPVDTITLTFSFDGDAFNIVEPVKSVEADLNTYGFAKEDGKVSLVNSLFAMREEKAVQSDLEYFQNKAMASVSTK